MRVSNDTRDSLLLTLPDDVATYAMNPRKLRLVLTQWIDQGVCYPKAIAAIFRCIHDVWIVPPERLVRYLLVVQGRKPRTTRPHMLDREFLPLLEVETTAWKDRVQGIATATVALHTEPDDEYIGAWKYCVSHDIPLALPFLESRLLTHANAGHERAASLVAEALVAHIVKGSQVAYQMCMNIMSSSAPCFSVCVKALCDKRSEIPVEIFSQILIAR